MNNCKVCHGSTERVMSFGKMPIANGFISEVSEEEFFYNLAVHFCPACFLVQLGETVKPEMMFNQNYHFISSTSEAMARHFEEMAGEITETVATKKSPLVVELGCNDGIMLKHIAAAGIDHIGIEPSGNVAALARQKGIRVREEFFNCDTAEKIVGKCGQADVICGANVMCHIEDINSVFAGVDILLKEDGVLFFEDPYLLDIIRKSTFDQIYDEHVYYFSGLSISELGRRHNLRLVDMAHQEVHGGSMRYYLKKNNSGPAASRAKRSLAEEKACNLQETGGYLNFKDRVDRICRDLKNTLGEIRRTGRHIAGYGATSKSTTLLNYAQIGPETIEYISDITPTKINKYTPGTHIPIKSHEFFAADNPPYTLLLAWNHKEEILKKEKGYREKGGKFITYFPEVSIE